MCYLQRFVVFVGDPYDTKLEPFGGGFKAFE